MKYSEFQPSDQPSHRLRELGAISLSNTELLSVALMIGDVETSAQIALLLGECDQRLSKISRDKLKAIKNIGDKTADMIAAIAELARRQALVGSIDKTTINSPADAAALVQYEMSALDHEELRVILADTRNQVRKIITVYKGSVNTSQVRVAEVFKDAIREQATAIIVVHNHPSGDPTPSPDDVAVTRAIVQAGRLMDVEVLDHIVIGQGRFVSLKERGLGF